MEWSLPSWAWWLAGVLGVAVAIFGGWWLWWWVPKQQVERLKFAIRDPKARADVEDNLRKTIGQLLGGAAVLIGAGLAYLEFTAQQETSRRQLEASLQQSEQQRQSARA